MYFFGQQLVTRHLSVPVGLRRLNTGSAWTPAAPTSINGYTPLFWFEAGEGYFEDTGRTTPAEDEDDAVASWEDQQGNLHAVQGTADRRPLLKLDQLNGYPVLDCSADQDVGFACGNPGNLATPVTLFFVGRFPPNLARTICEGLGGFRLLCQIREVRDTSNNSFTYTVPDTSYHILVMQLNGAGTSFVRIDGTQTGSSSDLVDTDDWRSFNLFYNVSSIDGYRSRGAELFGYTEVLTISEIETGEQYLSDKLSLSLS